MIRATIISAIDQALLSALSFGLSFMLIHFSTKQEYGLYAQLINLQPLLSPLHAGVFVSAYLAIAAKMKPEQQSCFRLSMTRAEMLVSSSSSLIIFAAGLCISRTWYQNITTFTCAAFSLALLGLWWREYSRQMQFSMHCYVRALRIDFVYCGIATLLVVAAAQFFRLDAAGILWCTGFAAIAATILPLLSAVKGNPSGAYGLSVRDSVSMSWSFGRWEVLGSFLTWGYAQSYVYFAAIHGGLDNAAEIAAGRLFATPLALMWAAFANVLRPTASNLLANSSHQEMRRLALRSVGFVLVSSILYVAAIYPLIPMINTSLLGGKFEHLQSMSIWWVIYICITGVTTVAASILRSAFEFRSVFTRQLISCIVAVILLSMTLKIHAPQAVIIAMIIVEMISMALFWRKMSVTIQSATNVTINNIREQPA